MRVLISLGLIFGLASCGAAERVGNTLFNRQAQKLVPFKAKLTSTKEDRRNFTVTVQANGADLEQTRESVRLPATRHCLRGFGSTQIAWDLDSEGDDWLGRANGEQITYSGRCIAR